MTNAMTVLTDEQIEKMGSAEQAIESVLSACEISKLREMTVLRQSVELATGIQKLRGILTDQVMKHYFMGLQGSKLGFVTDKDSSGGYPVETVREVLIEGMIRGLRPVGNEINIIAGQCYAAVNGVERLVLQFPGLTDLWIVPGVPQMGGDKGAFVPMRATWTLNRTHMEMVRDVEKREDGTMSDTRICVKVNSGMGPDAIIGKARRKMLFAIYQRVANSSFALRDTDDSIDVVGVPVTAAPTPAVAAPDQDGKRMRLGKPKPAADPEVDRGTNPENY